jgi:hypothetical protein
MDSPAYQQKHPLTPLTLSSLPTCQNKPTSIRIVLKPHSLLITGFIKSCQLGTFLILSLAARLMLLDWRAFYRTIRAKDAAIPLLWFEKESAGLAIIEKLAGISRHGFFFGMTAVRASDF